MGIKRKQSLDGGSEVKGFIFIHLKYVNNQYSLIYTTSIHLYIHLVTLQINYKKKDILKI